MAAFAVAPELLIPERKVYALDNTMIPSNTFTYFDEAAFDPLPWQADTIRFLTHREPDVNWTIDPEPRPKLTISQLEKLMREMYEECAPWNPNTIVVSPDVKMVLDEAIAELNPLMVSMDRVQFRWGEFDIEEDAHAIGGLEYWTKGDWNET